MARRVADILTAGGEDIGLVWGISSGSLSNRGKRVRLTKRTLCPHCSRGYRDSIQPIPDMILHDPAENGDPGFGRRVARRTHGGSSLGERQDRAGIG